MEIAQYIFSAITAVAIILLFSAFVRSRNKYSGPKGKESVLAGAWWITIFCCGLGLNLVYYIGSAVGKNVEDYFIGIAIKMFGFDFKSDALKATDGSAASIIYATAMVSCFIAAGLWTYLLLVKTFFKGIINSMKVWFHAHPIAFWRKDVKHYIVIGQGKQAKTFLKDLVYDSEDGSDDKHCSESDNERPLLAKWLKKANDSFNRKNPIGRKSRVAKKDGFNRFFVTIITGEPSGDKKKAEEAYKYYLEKGFTVIFGKPNEKNLIKAGIANKRRKTVVIALSDEDEENIAVADAVTCQIKARLPETFDKTSDSAEHELQKILLEAKIMYSFIERSEHFGYAEQAYGKIRFFNPYELRVRDFFWKHPITSFISNHIDSKTWKGRLRGEFKAGKIINPDTSKEYKIKNIFVGFGIANMKMLRGSILTGQLLGVDYNATVFDKQVADHKPTEDFATLLEKNLSSIQARFANHASGLFKGGDVVPFGDDDLKYFKSSIEYYNLEFVKADVLSRVFYNKLKKAIEDADFAVVYIALGNDKLAIETALEIRQSLLENCINIGRVKIFVKTRDKSALNSNRAIPSGIECFGYDSDVLRLSEIDTQDFDDLASALTNKNHDTPWAFLTETKRRENRQVALAARTKLQLLGLDLSLEGGDSCVGTYFERYFGTKADIFKTIDDVDNSGSKIDYLELDMDGKTIDDNARNNIARMEHLRWNTFQILEGWTKYPKACVSGNGSDGRQNKDTKQHACITTFEELIALRELQAAKAKFSEAEATEIVDLWKEFKKSNPDEAKLLEGKADTIWYDYSLMDDILRRRIVEKRKRKNESVSEESLPRIKASPFSIVAIKGGYNEE